MDLPVLILCFNEYFPPTVTQHKTNYCHTNGKDQTKVTFKTEVKHSLTANILIR